MKKDYTHIVLLLDRSGSMSTIKKDMDGGIKVFLEEQKAQPGQCTITAAQFDTVYEIIHSMKPIADVDKIEIKPRGGTALIDSMVRLINEVGNELSGLDEEERPDKVLFVTITDGEENSSREFNNKDLSELVAQQEKDFNWNFTYIGANQDAFSTSSKFGGRMDNSLNYEASSDGVKKMFSKLSDATTRYRSVDMSAVVGAASAAFNYTEEEQENI